MYLGDDGCVELKSVTKLRDEQCCFAKDSALQSNSPEPIQADENSSGEGSRRILDFNQNSESGPEKSLQGKIKKQLNDGINLATRQIRDRKQLMNRASEFIFPPKSSNLHGASESVSGSGRLHFTRTGEAKVSGQNQRIASNFTVQSKDNQNLKRNSTIGKSFKLTTKQTHVTEKSSKDASQNQDKLIQDLNSIFSARAKLHRYRNKSRTGPPQVTFHNRFNFRENYPPAPGHFEISRRGQNSRFSDSSFSSDDSN